MKTELVLFFTVAALGVMLWIEMTRHRDTKIKARRREIERNLDGINKALDDNEAGYSEALAKLEPINLDDIKFIGTATEDLRRGDQLVIDSHGRVSKYRATTDRGRYDPSGQDQA